jgi:DNA oxidative demethylase
VRQKSLFAIREIPEGLIFKPDFLTVQEERDLFALLQTMPFYEFKLHGVAAKRRVLHFGLRYALESRVLSTAPEIPSQFEPLRRRAAEFAGVAPDEFSQILVTNTGQAQALAGITTRPLLELWQASHLGRHAPCAFNMAAGESAERLQ